MRFASVTLALVVMALAACGSSPAPGAGSSGGASSLTASSKEPSGGGRVLLRGLENPQAYAAGGDLYVARQVTPPGDTVFSELMRVDPVSGRVRVVRRLGSAFDQALLAGGVLWVSTTRGVTSSLWRLDPRSLAVRSREILPGSGQSDGSVGTMALAGGWLWVGNSDRLDRVSLADGEVTGAVGLRDASGIDVAADPTGRVLMVSEGHELARLQRRDPATGALIGQSPIFSGVTKPYIGGIFGGGAWISESGGMMGAVERLSLATLQPAWFPGAQPHPGEFGPPRIEGTNGIAARLIDGILWVTQPFGGARRNYCGDPMSGRPRAAPRLPSQAWLETADATSIYYVTGPSSPIRAELVRAPINPRCRASGRTVASKAPSSRVSRAVRATRVCATSQLGIRTIHSFAGLGTSGAYLAFTNRSRTACELTGWPSLVGITAIGKSTAATDWPAESFPGARITGTPIVTLAPGRRADVRETSTTVKLAARVAVIGPERQPAATSAVAGFLAAMS